MQSRAMTSHSIAAATGARASSGAGPPPCGCARCDGPTRPPGGGQSWPATSSSSVSSRPAAGGPSSRPWP
eukprot:8037489-Lingulodinium_polyedra.AAC.1